MKNFILSLVLFLALLTGCQSTSGSIQARLGVDVQVAAGQEVVGFARSAPIQGVHVIGFRYAGKVKIMDLSTGLVLWEGIAGDGQVLVLIGSSSETFAQGEILPFAASLAFADPELIRINGVLTVPGYGLRFEDDVTP